MPAFLESLEYLTFTSAWYWVFIALAWSSRAHWTISIPFDAIVRAERRGAQWEEDLDNLAQIMSRRVNHFARGGGVWGVAIVTFALAALITGSIVTQSQFVRGLTAVAVPMAIAAFGDIRLALRIHDTGLRGYHLRRALVWRRFLNQATGLFSLLLAASMGALTALQHSGYLLW